MQCYKQNVCDRHEKESYGTQTKCYYYDYYSRSKERKKGIHFYDTRAVIKEEEKKTLRPCSRHSATDSDGAAVSRVLAVRN